MKGEKINEETNSPNDLRFNPQSGCGNSSQRTGNCRVDNQFPLHQDFLRGDIIRTAGTLHRYDIDHHEKE